MLYSKSNEFYQILVRCDPIIIICVLANEYLWFDLCCDSADNNLIRYTVCTEINITHTYLHQHTFDNNKDHSVCNYIARRVMYFSFDRGKACKIRTGWKGEIKVGCVIFVRSVLHYGWWRHIKQSYSMVTSNIVWYRKRWEPEYVDGTPIARQQCKWSNGSDKRAALSRPTTGSNLAYGMAMMICVRSATIQWSPTGRPRRLEMLLLKDVLLSCEYCTKCFQFSMHYSDVWGLTDNII